AYSSSIQVSGIEPDIELEYAPLPEKDEDGTFHLMREEDLDNHMVNEDVSVEKEPLDIDEAVPDTKKLEKDTPEKKEEEMPDEDVKEKVPEDAEEENDIDTLYMERLARDNQVRMAVQVLKSWSVIQQIKSGGISDNIQAN
ncbi:MAG: hypothetical protein PVG39_30015, partial [Desulfobacteraceae bacterium]